MYRVHILYYSNPVPSISSADREPPSQQGYEAGTDRSKCADPETSSGGLLTLDRLLRQKE